MSSSHNGFDDWLYKELYLAYLDARKGKRKTTDEHRFEVNDLTNLLYLRDLIVERRYKPGRGIAFITEKPVIREIFAAPFVDRVVHHFLCNIIVPWWEPRLSPASYSCRKEKGTLYGIRDLERKIRRISQNYTRETYVIKLDLQGYFMSLSRKKLYERIMWGLKRQFPNGGELYQTVKYLFYEIIFDDPIKGIKIKGKKSDWDNLPPSKSLFYQPKGQGIVIGNLTSQVLSNIYLDQLDRFVTLELGYKGYGRYVDDFYIIVEKERFSQAKRDVEVIERYLHSIGLTLHPRKRYMQEIHKGVEFLGVVVYPGRIVPGKRTKGNFKEAVHLLADTGESPESVTSYLGHLKYTKSTKLIRETFGEVGWNYPLKGREA